MDAINKIDSIDMLYKCITDYLKGNILAGEFECENIKMSLTLSERNVIVIEKDQQTFRNNFKNRQIHTIDSYSLFYTVEKIRFTRSDKNIHIYNNDDNVIVFSSQSSLFKTDIEGIESLIVTSFKEDIYMIFSEMDNVEILTSIVDSLGLFSKIIVDWRKPGLVRTNIVIEPDILTGISVEENCLRIIGNSACFAIDLSKIKSFCVTERKVDKEKSTYMVINDEINKYNILIYSSEE